MANTGARLTCETCGARVAVTKAGAGALACCGRPMRGRV
jgi:desulfoferrodoxin-like iron-binding protein